jgi:hypothetical protein
MENHCDLFYEHLSLCSEKEKNEAQEIVFESREIIPFEIMKILERKYHKMVSPDDKTVKLAFLYI